MMRTAMLGGSFNPIHNGHIEIAQAIRKMYGIDRVLLMVANDPPHKKVADGTAAEDRFRMAQLALESIQGVIPCDLELKRSGKSYTADTVCELHDLYPEDEIYCIMGADMLLSLDTWHDAPMLLKSAKFIAVGRPDAGSMETKAEELRRKYGADIYLSGIMGPDISSTMVREAVRQGRSKAGLLPDAVADYIYQNGLFFPEDVDALCSKLRRELDPKRYAHTMGVTRSAVELAQRYGEDGAKARLGALLHDCAKLPVQRQLELATEYGMDISGMPLPIIHGPLGAERAKREFGITDGEVLSAISCHTVCRTKMSDLDKIVYLADKIEKGRTYEGVEAIRSAAQKSLNKGMIASMEHSLDYLHEQGMQVHPETLRLLRELKTEEEKLQKEEKV